MEPLSPDQLKAIAATHSIEYEPLQGDERIVATRLARIFPLSRDDLFRIALRIEDRPKLFSHYGAVKLVDRAGLEGVISENQFLAISEIKEGAPKLSFARYTVDAPKRIVEEIVTNPFSEVQPKADRKDAVITYDFEEVGANACKMRCESTFRSLTDEVLVKRGLIDRIWFDFLENLMVEAGELQKSAKLAGP